MKKIQAVATLCLIFTYTCAHAGNPCDPLHVSTATACAGPFNSLDDETTVNDLSLFGFDDWTFAQSIFSGGTTEIDLGLMATINQQDQASGDWSVDSFGSYTQVMMLLRPQDFVVGGDNFTAFLLDLSMTSGTYASFFPDGSGIADIQRISLFVRPAVVPLPLPLIMFLSALGALIPAIRKRS